VRIQSGFFYLFLAALPIGFRATLHKFTPGFDEYEAIFLYANDLALIIFLCVCGSGILKEIRDRNFWDTRRGANIFLFAFLALAGVSVFAASYKLLAGYAFLRLILAVFLALSATHVFSSARLVRTKTFWALSILGAAEALLGFGQFLFQRGFGLRFLGEPFLPALLSPDFAVSAARFAPGIAKIDLWGAKLIRAYGTFPHPNILSAFLLIGLFSACYLWLTSEQVKFHSRPRFSDWARGAGWRVGKEIGLGILIFILWLGLMVTFSRTGWLLAAFFSFGLAFYFMLFADTRRAALKLFGMLISIFIIFSTAFPLFVFPRAGITASEPSVSYRLAYDELALKIIEREPFGIGIGNQLIFSVEGGLYKALGMPERWQWQPVHNIYLLAAAEIGIGGAALFVIFLFALGLRALHKLMRRGIEIHERVSLGIATAIFSAFLLFGLVDHFFWTLQPGRLMFWLSIGIMLGALKAVEKRPGS